MCPELLRVTARHKHEERGRLSVDVVIHIPVPSLQRESQVQTPDAWLLCRGVRATVMPAGTLAGRVAVPLLGHIDRAQGVGPIPVFVRPRLARAVTSRAHARSPHWRRVLLSMCL